MKFSAALGRPVASSRLSRSTTWGRSACAPWMGCMSMTNGFDGVKLLEHIFPLKLRTFYIACNRGTIRLTLTSSFCMLMREAATGIYYRPTSETGVAWFGSMSPLVLRRRCSARRLGGALPRFSGITRILVLMLCAWRSLRYACVMGQSRAMGTVVASTHCGRLSPIQCCMLWGCLGALLLNVSILLNLTCSYCANSLPKCSTALFRCTILLNVADDARSAVRSVALGVSPQAPVMAMMAPLGAVGRVPPTVLTVAQAGAEGAPLVCPQPAVSGLALATLAGPGMPALRQLRTPDQHRARRVLAGACARACCRVPRTRADRLLRLRVPVQPVRSAASPILLVLLR